MLIRHLRGFLQALAQPRTPATGPAPRLRYVYASEGAAARYRVFHGVEESQFSGMHAEVAQLADPERLYRLHNTDLLILHRITLGPRSVLLLFLARKYGLKVAFDSDDLIWDVQQRQYEFLDQHYSAPQIQRILRTARRTLKLMKRVDALILSTDYLANLAQDATQRPAFTLHNAISIEMQQHAHQALHTQHPPDDLVRIGYFSGHARVHDEDFATLGPVLAQLLIVHPQLIITLVGEVALPQELTAFTLRIERRSAVDWRLLPNEIARVSINIAPLVENPQRRSKSGIKYLEAALVGVPTVALALEPYQSVIEPGVTGLLAGSPNEWHQALNTLITNPELRQRIGSAARQHVLTHHTTAVRATQLTEVVQAILNQRITHNA